MRRNNRRDDRLDTKGAAALHDDSGIPQARVGESYRALFAGVGHTHSHLPALKAATHYLRQTCPSRVGRRWLAWASAWAAG